MFKITQNFTEDILGINYYMKGRVGSGVSIFTCNELKLQNTQVNIETPDLSLLSYCIFENVGMVSSTSSSSVICSPKDKILI